MPYPSLGFPIPPFEWPHVGRQWPAYNVESDQADGLKAWWSMLASHGAGIVRELVGEQRGTVSGASWNVDPLWGPALYFTTNDYVNIPHNAQFNPGTAAFSIAALFKTDSTPASTQGIVTKRVPSGTFEQWGLYVLSSGYVEFFTRDTGLVNTYRDSSVIVADSKWHRVVATRHSGTIDIFVDGVLANGALTGSGDRDLNMSQPVRFGDANGSSYFDGSIAECRYYNRRTTAAGASIMQQKPWDLHPLPRRLWRLGVVAPPPATIVPVAMHHYRSMRL